MKSGKTFLILGASSDLGVALLKRLNEEYTDSSFVLHYHSSDEALKKIEFKNNNKGITLKADFSDEKEVQAFISAIEERELIPTHVVHLPASKLVYTRLKDFDRDRIDRNVRIQVYSFVEIMKAFLPAMVKRKDHNKVVVALSSVVTGQPQKSMLEYTAVKSMLLGVVRQLAADNAGKKININAISPSMIETKLLSEIDPKIVALAAEGSNEKRNATVDDIVPGICFLLSDDSNYLSGVNLNLSNGNVIL
jgi:3-oxoacyl-[acyl-carrier protein] reductase